MFFQENKRLKKKSDRAKLRDFKRDIFDETISVKDTIEKYFKFTTKAETEHNISYKNTTCKMVSKWTRNMLQKRGEYQVGEMLICRTCFKVMKKITFNVNYEYKITEVKEQSLVLDGGVELPLHVARTNFIHGYCKTCHSFQGSSIDKPLTIYDWQFKHVDRKWIYTACTRATNLANVSFFTYEEREDKDEGKLNTLLQRKVEGYRNQDKRANRAIEPNKYITVEWLKNAFGSCCGNCGDVLTYTIDDDGKIETPLTAQRINNTAAHTIDNILPYCKWCNCALSNKE